MATRKSCRELMDRLAKAQNHPANINRDVMSWAGFCDNEAELALHVEAREARVAAFEIDELLRKASRKLVSTGRAAAKARAAYAI